MHNLAAERIMTEEQKLQWAFELEKQKKSEFMMYALYLLTGIFGGHRFYLGDKRYGLCMLLTIGGFLLWWMIDAFVINERRVKINVEIEKRILQGIIGEEKEKKPRFEWKPPAV